MLLMIAEGGRGECFIIDLFDPRRWNRLEELELINLWGNLFQERTLTVGLRSLDRLA